MPKPETVDEYIAVQPPEARKILVELRKIIKKSAPDAQEKLSYGMPYYSLNGRLLYLGAFKAHVSLFAMPSAVKKFQRELKGYGQTKAAIHFPFGQPLDKELVRKIIEFRIAENRTKPKK
ncbi:MAG TPA: DUF1801 domain-containing protein [Candidatus Saccharimonadales bacterium]|nr:DUF1801 domain-containing protein [Candidatus Saccharimonadales bacterium]